MTMKKMTRRGQSAGGLLSFGLEIGILAIGIGIISTVLVGVQSTQTSDSTAYNNTASAVTAMGTYSSWYSTLILIGIAVVVIGLLFVLKRFGGGGA